MGSELTVPQKSEEIAGFAIQYKEAKGHTQKSKSPSSQRRGNGSSSTSSNSSTSRKLILPHERGDFRFDSNKDEDYTGGDSNGKHSMIQKLIKAFNQARKRLEEEFRSIDFRRTRHVGDYISVSNWLVTMVDTIAVLGDNGELQRLAFPVDMTATVRIEVSLGIFAEYKAHIDLDNPITDYRGEGPHGPHVGWDYHRIGSDGPKGRTGHILLDVNKHMPDRHRGMSYDGFVNLMKDEPIKVIDPKMIFDGSLDGADFLIMRMNIYYDTYDEDWQQRSTFHILEHLYGDQLKALPRSNFFRKYKK